MDGHRCRNCGHELTGEFCAECGQHAHEGSPSMAHVFHELVHEILHVDGKIFRTIRALFLRPGLLTAEYWEGHIVSWIRPLRLFLIVAAVHLFAAHHSVGPLNFRVGIGQNAAGERHVAITPDPNGRLPAGFRPLSEDQSREFFEKFRKAYASIRYASVILFAAAAWLLFHRRQPWFANHLIFGLHFYAFWYVLSIPGDASRAASQIGQFFTLLYLVVALRRLYGGGWWRNVGRGAVLMIVLLLIELLLGSAAARLVETA